MSEREIDTDIAAKLCIVIIVNVYCSCYLALSAFSFFNMPSCPLIVLNDIEFAAIIPLPLTAGIPIPGKQLSPHTSKFLMGVFGNGNDPSPA